MFKSVLDGVKYLKKAAESTPDVLVAQTKRHTPWRRKQVDDVSKRHKVKANDDLSKPPPPAQIADVANGFQLVFNNVVQKPLRMSADACYDLETTFGLQTKHYAKPILEFVAVSEEIFPSITAAAVQADHGTLTMPALRAPIYIGYRVCGQLLYATVTVTCHLPTQLNSTQLNSTRDC